jgi:hypothetical protein
MSLVSGVRKDGRMRILIILNVIRFLILTPDTRHLKPVWLKEKIDKLNPYFTNYLCDTTLEVASKSQIRFKGPAFGGTSLLILSI